MTWRELSATQSGTISGNQLRESGVSQRTVAAMVARGELARLNSGLYLVGGAPLTQQAQLWAGVLATDGVVAFASAAHVWGVIRDAPPVVHVVVPHARRPRPPEWVRLHRTFLDRRRVVRKAGLPVTSQAQTVLDHLGCLNPSEAMRLADRAFQKGWLDHTSIERRLADEPKRRGNTILRAVLAQSGDGAAAESERRLHRILRQGGIRGWMANHPVFADGAMVAVVDVAIEAARLAIEVDGWAFHSDVDRFRRDRHRQNDLVALGWTVLRFTWADLTERPGYVLGRIRSALPTSGRIRT